MVGEELFLFLSGGGMFLFLFRIDFGTFVLIVGNFPKMATSHLSVCPTLVHLEDLPDKRKMSYGRINRQKQIENEQKKISFYPVGDPRVPKRVLGGWLKKCWNLKFQMGITGAPFCPIGMKLWPTTPA